MSYRIGVILLLLIFNTPVAFAQSLHVNASVDKQKILIGEPVSLTLQLTAPKNSIVTLPKIDSILHFEILSKSAIDSQLNGNTIRLQQIYTLTSWDSGKWQLPAVGLSPSNKTKPIAINVGFTPFDTTKDYHDVKDILEVQKPPRTTWYWYVIGIIILLLFFLLMFPGNKQKPPAAKVSNDTAYQEALQQLEELKKQNVIQKDVKLFYTKLIDIFRTYLQKRKNIQSFSKTTDDLAVQMKSLNIPADHYNILVQTLRLSDLVKFAQAVPNGNENETSLQTIKNSIDRIEGLK